MAFGGDAAFQALAHEIIEDYYRRSPSSATYLGVHTYDDRLEDFSRDAIAAHVNAARAFRARLDALDPAALTLDARLDREFLQGQMDATVIQLDVVRSWAKDADSYATAATNSVYTIMKRSYAPAAERLKFVVAREKQMPALLAEARRNLENPPRIFTELAIEQIDGNRSFFENDLPAAFAGVDDPALVAEFAVSNAAVIAALGEYKTWLVDDLLPRSNGSFALGADTYSRLLAANELIDEPLDRLLEIAEADLRKNADAFVETAKRIDPATSTADVLREVEANHPPAAALLETTQNALDALRQFILDRTIATIPASAPARVQETPPFMRSTTSASMDTPGPFEATATEAYYNMTLPDPRWTPAEQADFMRQWYFASISNVSVHEVYPGHYLQFLYAKAFPTATRKVFGATTNIEGWAHYAEEMMLDEGFHAGEPAYRLAQLQDALLRDIRFIAGIKMHTQGMSVDEARTMFATQGRQPPAIALAEAKRGAGDPFYGYYTMGKLAILKLRSDYQTKMGAAFSVMAFHDEFIRMGPLPLPLVRERMLGSRGSLF
ncbi:MAG: DUF885 domain-containing protein [Acidobacteria bacterium]|nr:MAG: DUF885 domain-containing protein [Acidobacteriota bacterium]